MPCSGAGEASGSRPVGRTGSHRAAFRRKTERRMENTHALAASGCLSWSRAPNALRQVSWTRSSAASTRPTRRRAARYRSGRCGRICSSNRRIFAAAPGGPSSICSLMKSPSTADSIPERKGRVGYASCYAPRGQHAESFRGVSSRRGRLERRAHPVRDLWRHRDVHPRAPASDDRYRPPGTAGRGRADRRIAPASRVRSTRASTHSAGQGRGRDAPAHQDRPRGSGGALTRRDRSPAGGNQECMADTQQHRVGRTFRHGGLARRAHRPQEAPRLATGHGGHRPARGHA